MKILDIVITGGTSGLGRQIVKALLKQGNNIINLDVLVPPKSWLESPPACRCDVTNIEEVRRAAEASDIRHLDVLINCAGINLINWIEDTTEEEWNRIIDVNVKGIFNTCKVFLEQLKTAGGTILNIVSNAGHAPRSYSIAYNASKAAASVMTEQMALELGIDGITVFGISPNRLKGTGMTREMNKAEAELRGWTDEELEWHLAKSLPAGEETDPATLAEFIAFILSTKQRHKYMAGTIIPYGKQEG